MKNKKRIVISSYDDLKNPVYSGGGAISVNKVSERLAKDYHVTVITGTYKGAVDEVKGNVEYFRIGSDIFGHKIGQLIYQLALIKKAFTLKFDCWIESATPPFTFSLLPLLTSKPVISWVGMLSSEDMKRKYIFDFRFVENVLARFYIYFIVPSKWVRDEIVNMNKKARINLIPWGYSASYSIKKYYKKLFPYSKHKYLLFMGRVEINQKGLDLLLRALSYSHKDISLVIAGDGELSEVKKLKRLAEDYLLDKRIYMTGRVKGDQKADLFANACATVITSRFETFSLTALESFSYQVPVICFNIPQLEWIPDELSHKVEPFDAKAMARIFNNVVSLDNSKLQRHATQKFLKDLSWDTVTTKIKRIIQNTL